MNRVPRIYPLRCSSYSDPLVVIPLKLQYSLVTSYRRDKVSYKILKVHKQGRDNISRGFVIPHEYVKELNIGEYLRVTMENGRIYLDKLE